MKRRLALGILATIIAIAFIVIGILDGETAVVLRKAGDICLSCIGIG